MSEYQPETPGARRRALVHLAIATAAALLALALLQAAQPAVLEWVRADPESVRTRARIVLGVLAVIVLAPVAGLAIYLWLLGTRVLREERFPPERLALIRDVRVVRGDAARTRGRALRTAAAVLLAMTGLMGLALWRLAV
jgi:hypothetical protein